MVELAGDAQGIGQVVVADPENVDAVDGGDRVDVVEAPGRLDLRDAAASRRWRSASWRWCRRRVIVVRDAERGATTAGGVLGRLDDALRLLGRLDHRDHDSPGAHIQGRARKWYSLAGTRTIGTSASAWDVASRRRMVSMLQPVCSMS